MKDKLIKSGMLLAAMLLQFSVVQKLNIGSFTVNLCLMSFIGVCLFSDTTSALIFGGVYGFLIDGAIGRNFGVNTLLYLYLALAIKLFANESHKNSPALTAMDAAAFSSLFYLVYGLASFTVLRSGITVGRWLVTALVQGLFSGTVFLAVFAFKDKFSKGGTKRGRTI